MFNLETISPKMLDYYVNNRKAFIIDLRRAADFFEGHIKGAVSVPYEGGRFVFRPPKDKDIVLYCESGTHSLMAARELVRDGYRVRSVIGGIRAYTGKYMVR